MINNENIICISSIDWDFIWQIPQEMMTNLAKSGNRILFIDNLGVRMPLFKDRARIKKRILNWHKGIYGIRQERVNLFVFSPIIFPFPYSRLTRWINRHILLSTLRKWFKVMNFNNAIIWTFLPSPIVLDLIANLEDKLTVYYCADNFSSSSLPAKKIRKSEQALLKKVDLVFATSKELYAYCSKYSQFVHLLSSGVDFELFNRFNNVQSEPPPELSSFKSPVIGYVGGIHKWVDLRLLEALAKLNPEFSFVFVGPIHEQIGDLARCKNVYFLGAKDHLLLPQYIKFFDVAIIPYLCLDYTNSVFPVKLNEYFAVGKPVISSPLPEIKLFNEKYGGNLVYIANDANEFSARIRQAIKENSEELVTKRIAVAADNSWNKKFKELTKLIEKRIEIKNLDQQAKWRKSLLLFYRNTRRKLVVVTFILLTTYLSLFCTPFVWFVAKPLKIVEAPRPAEAIVVFAGGVGESGKAVQGYEERVEYAVKLYKSGFAKHLIFSSGYMYYFKEPLIMKALAVSLGVPEGDIILEDQAKNTYENVLFSKEILDKNNWHKILIVSAPYHMRRVALVAHKNAPGLDVVFTPVPNSVFYRHGVTEEQKPTLKQLNAAQLKAILHEYAGIIFYWFKGWI